MNWKSWIILPVFLTHIGLTVADEWTSISIPLRDGKTYSLDDFRRECRDKLGIDVSPGKSDKIIELTTLERAALLAANEAGLLRVELAKDHLVIQVPNSEDDAVRKRNRQRLESLLGVSLTDWPANKGMHFPQTVVSNRRSVLLIHGLGSNKASLTAMALALERSSLQVFFFDYPHNGPIAWSGDRLSDELKSLATKYPDIRLTIVAHSMGGLVARHCLEMPGRNPGCVTDVFMLGTPNHGSLLAAANNWIRLVCEIIPSGGGYGPLQEGLGEAEEDLRPNSQFLQTLNKQDRPGNARYHLGIGRRGYLTADVQSKISVEIDRLLTRQGATDQKRQTIADFFKAEELRSDVGDGAVSIRSARLSNVQSIEYFDLNHSQLIDLPEQRPEEGELFRWIIKTMRWEATKRPQ